MALRAVTLAALTLLAACAQPAPQVAEWTGGPITDEATFRREIVGRPLTAANDVDRITAVVNGEGGLAITFTSKATSETRDGASGVWEWREGSFCRELSNAGASPASECQTVSKTGDAATFTSPNGRTTRWTVGSA